MAYRHKIDREDVPTLLSIIPKSSIFTVVFVKKNNEVRVMNCRRGVTSHLNPNPIRKRAPMPPNEVTVFDLKANGYRMFNLDTIMEIKTLGNDFLVTDKRRKQ